MNEFLARTTFLPRPKTIAWLRAYVPVAGAILFFVLWTVAEAGRSPHLFKEGMFLLWAVALGLAGIRPRLALAGTIAIPVLIVAAGLIDTPFYDLPGVYTLYVLPSIDYLFSLSTSWPAWFAAPIIVGYVASMSPSWRRRINALVVGLISAIVYGIVLGVAGWLSWVGDHHGYSALVNEASGLAFSLLAAVLFAWVIGIGLSALWRVEIVSERLETTTAQLGEADLELRLAHDRGRISRDIHDSLAHSLAIIVAQAEGAAAIHELKPAAAPESLGNIATVARHALTEVRLLVERINDDEDVSEHTSRIEHIPALIAELRQAGVDATLRTLGTIDRLALSKQVAVFRIAQESLTNALKHGGRGSSATVTLDAQGAGLAVLIVSKSGGGTPLVNGGGRGIGIAGMKERARLVGGWLTAVPSDDETFVVTAFIPPDATAAGEEPAVEASDDVIDADSETAALAIEGARD
ncbi:sensor histidine kinase [Gryllotalpicola protaetiae]|nr:histidine kinase [Gryllotalpicola protaetiae]